MLTWIEVACSCQLLLPYISLLFVSMIDFIYPGLLVIIPVSLVFCDTWCWIYSVMSVRHCVKAEIVYVYDQI